MLDIGTGFDGFVVLDLTFTVSALDDFCVIGSLERTDFNHLMHTTDSVIGITLELNHLVDCRFPVSHQIGGTYDKRIGYQTVLELTV